MDYSMALFFGCKK